jgi:flagellar biosynthesis anti-sigma factor FlgM
MKIQGDRPEFNKPLTDRVETNRASEVGGGRGAAASQATSSDQVSVSPDAKLASAAITAAQKTPDVRPEAVARGKALLESGKLGTDVEHLADLLIDRGLDS